MKLTDKHALLDSAVFIGLDPAIRKGGFGCATLDANGAANVFTWDAVELITYLYTRQAPKQNVLLTIENSNITKTLFRNKRGKKGAKDSGMNMGISQLITDIMISLGYDVEAISPKEKGKKMSPIDIKRFVKTESAIISIEGSLDDKLSDKRDALAILIIGKKRREGTIVKVV